MGPIRRTVHKGAPKGGHKSLKGFLNTVKLFVGGGMCSLSAYAFFRTPLFDLGSIRKVSIQFPEDIGFGLMVFGLLIVGVSFVRENENFSDNAFTFSAIFYFLSVAPYSELEWLKLAGVDVPMVIPFWRSLLIGSVITLGYLLLYFVDKTEESTDQLRGRGAEEENVQKLGYKKLSYATATIAGGFSLSISAIALVFFAGPSARPFIAKIANPQLLCVGSVILASLVLTFYFLSETRAGQ